MARIPAFGLVVAAPHEHLVLIRSGAVVRSQQGGSVWRWPGDTVACIDTSVRRLKFTADQVTREKTGVQVTGLAVYRVVEPLVAWRMLDMNDPERVEGILAEMFVGATRRLVANLSLEDCLTRRKDALAAELVAEVAPVVSGRGAPGDATDRGWGIAIDTIEIQDVRVLSDEVFTRLQAPFRGKLALDAVRAEAEVERASAAVREEVERRAEDHRRAMLALAQSRVEAERAARREELAHETEIASTKLAAELERRRIADAAARAEADARAEAAVGIAEREAQALRLRAEAESAKLRLERAALDDVSEARLREILLTTTIPEAAKGLRGLVGEVQVRPGELDGLVEIAGRVAAALRPA
jgi:hypothetical protein